MSKFTLPSPDPSAYTHHQKTEAFIKNIIAREGPISFAHFMQHALYAPGLGYYSAGSRKFGRDGDFVTAPEISPLFSRCLAQQCHSILTHLNNADILELGAGSGKMAADLLEELNSLNSLPQHYFILEISADLRQRQQQLLQERLPYFFNRIHWLDRLPENFCGVILANEVVDAMPVHRFHVTDQMVEEYFVDWQENKFSWKLVECSNPTLREKIKALNLPSDYSSEINLHTASWLQALANSLQQGALLILDYGFPQHEYYHLERSMGTLICHYRHYAHDDPLILTGIQDITAHVDFTAIAQEALAAGFESAGYASQAQWLINCGIMEMASRLMQNDRSQFEISQQIKLLTLPTEMGELFKIIGFTKNFSSSLEFFPDHIGRLFS